MELRANVPEGPVEQKWDRHRFELKLVNPANKRKYDVIVVGSGLAGASAAWSLLDKGNNSGGSPSVKPGQPQTVSASPHSGSIERAREIACKREYRTALGYIGGVPVLVTSMSVPRAWLHASSELGS